MDNFNLNFNFGFGMNNWFMPSLSFPSFNFFQSFQMPFLNFLSSNYSNNYIPISQYSVFDYNTKSKSDNIDTFTKTKNINIKTDKLSLDDYNATKGKRLASVALKNSTGWTGFCARYVKQDIQEAGLGFYRYCHAYQMTSILRQNPNFKEISPDNVNLKDLPEGCVLVYGKGVQGYSKNYGHTEITVKDKKTGESKGVSDGITNNLYKKPSAIFIPV